MGNEPGPTQHQVVRSSGRWLIIAVIAVAAILRLQHITQPFTDYISWRQASVAMMAENFYRTNWNILYPEVNWSGKGPNYQGREFQTVSYIAALLYAVVGQHDWVGRGVAVSFGLWGIFALYQLVRRAWGNDDCALAAAAVMAVLPGSIFFDRSFLQDPAMVALVVTACWMFVAYLQTNHRHYLLLAALLASWGFATKLPGLVALVPMTYAAVSMRHAQPDARLRTFAILAAAVVSLIPLIAYYKWILYLGHTYPPFHVAGEGNYIWDRGIRDFWSHKFYFAQLRWNAQWIWGYPALVLLGFGLLLYPPGLSPESGRGSATGTTAPWLFHWWIIGAGVFYCIAALEVKDNSWNLYIISPAIAALAGRALVGFGSLPFFIFNRAVAAILVLVILAQGNYALRRKYFPSPGSSVQGYELGLALRKATRPGDLVTTISGSGEPVAIFYSGRRGWVFPPPWPGMNWWDALPEDDDMLIQWLEELRELGATWLGITGEQQGRIRERHLKFRNHVENTCDLHSAGETWSIYKLRDLTGTRAPEM